MPLENTYKMLSSLIRQLCCPITHQPLELASDHIIYELNTKIKNNSITNAQNEQVTQTIKQGLIRQDKKLLFPIINHIPIMTESQAIVL